MLKTDTLATANAATHAYHQEIKRVRDEDWLELWHPLWMKNFASVLAEHEIKRKFNLKEPKRSKLKRAMKRSGIGYCYLKLSYTIRKNITSKVWFDSLVMIIIFLIGIATGLEIELDGSDDKVNTFVDATSLVTTIVFTLEVALKIIAEGFSPLQYFTDSFNTFDFAIVLLTYIATAMGAQWVSTLGTLRIIRLLRLLKLVRFVKGAPQLRAIIAGLLKGIESVVYIAVVMALLLYLMAIISCSYFGKNDPARFGTVSMAMVTLFQISCLTSWQQIAYSNWYGCENFLGDTYAVAQAKALDPAGPHETIRTNFGEFLGYTCDTSKDQPVVAFLFFSFVVCFMGWFVMSLFIGVISNAMFEKFELMQEKKKLERYRKRIIENSSHHSEVRQGGGFFERKKRPLKDMIDTALFGNEAELLMFNGYTKFAGHCRSIKKAKWFNTVVLLVIIAVGLVSGIEVDQMNRCTRVLERADAKDDNEAENSSVCTDTAAFYALRLAGQVVFVMEAIVKVIAEGKKPLKYFYDPQEGSWNTLDFFVVVIGFFDVFQIKELKSFSIISALRLLRLLRLFRLAKTLPRLRSIIDALISSLASASGFCVLLGVFNYIAGCAGVLFFRERDPFHFGTIPRSMFTFLRLETLDTWDEVLQINLYGCVKSTRGYPYLMEADNIQCDERTKGGGWLACAIFCFVIIIGALIFPTVLIGLVTLRFEESKQRSNEMERSKEKKESALERAQNLLPDFFTPDRIDALETVFCAMDADGGGTLIRNRFFDIVKQIFQIGVY